MPYNVFGQFRPKDTRGVSVMPNPECQTVPGNLEECAGESSVTRRTKDGQTVPLCDSCAIRFDQQHKESR